jgi:hypothetical protein
MLPHPGVGDSECCGLLRGVIRDDTAHTERNERGAYGPDWAKRLAKI